MSNRIKLGPFDFSTMLGTDNNYDYLVIGTGHVGKDNKPVSLGIKAMIETALRADPKLADTFPCAIAFRLRVSSQDGTVDYSIEELESAFGEGLNKMATALSAPPKRDSKRHSLMTLGVVSIPYTQNYAEASECVQSNMVGFLEFVKTFVKDTELVDPEKAKLIQNWLWENSGQSIAQTQLEAISLSEKFDKMTEMLVKAKPNGKLH